MLAAVQELKRKGARVLGVVNVVGSAIAREADGGIYVHAGPEVCVVSTKCFTNTTVAFALLALHLGHGAASWLQSLGLRHPKYPTDRLGPALAVFLFVGYMIPPTAVLVGLLQLPGS